MDQERYSSEMCTRCLYREMNDNAYYNYIKNYLENMDQADKVSDAEYTLRLQQCKECDYLYNGMCRHCGCFVEIRCASVHRHCPDHFPKW